MGSLRSNPTPRRLTQGCLAQPSKPCKTIAHSFSALLLSPSVGVVYGTVLGSVGSPSPNCPSSVHNILKVWPQGDRVLQIDATDAINAADHCTLLHASFRGQ